MTTVRRASKYFFKNRRSSVIRFSSSLTKPPFFERMRGEPINGRSVTDREFVNFFDSDLPFSSAEINAAGVSSFMLRRAATGAVRTCWVRERCANGGATGRRRAIQLSVKFSLVLQQYFQAGNLLSPAIAGVRVSACR